MMKNSKLKFSEYMQNISRSKSFGKFVLIVLVKLLERRNSLTELTLIHTLPFKMFGPFGSVWCKIALGEVGVSLP